MTLTARPRRVAAALAVLTAVVAAIAGAGARPAAADTPAVTVTWPEVTRFNPTATTYEFTVATDAGASANLFYSWGAPDADVRDVHADPVPDTGTVTMDFPTDEQGHGAVRIWSCPTAAWSTACTEAARSPELDVWSQMRVMPVVGGQLPWRRSGVQHVDVWYGPQPPLAGTPTATWEILDANQQPLATPVVGTIQAADLAIDPATGLANIPFTIPVGLPSGTYYLDIHMAVDTSDFGHLEGSMGAPGSQLLELPVDNDAPVLTVRKTPAVLYPVGDGYLDALTVYATATEQTTGTFAVTNAAGTRVYQSTGHRITTDEPQYYDMPSWSGRNNAGKIVPDGRYTMKLTVTDNAGNAASWAAPVAVSHKQLKWTTFTRTVTAAASRTGKPYVGRCSTLASPAKGGPAGSLGFYSRTRCTGTAGAGTVASDHGMYIPKAFANHYDWAQVTLNGGPASASRANYIVMGYVSPSTGKMIYPRQFGTGTGAHPGQRMNVAGRVIFDMKTNHPYMIWTNGLNGGSRYNVRSYTVAVRYQALR